MQANTQVLNMDPWARLLDLTNLDTPPDEWLENQFFDLSADDYGGYGAAYYDYGGDGIVATRAFTLAPAAAPQSARLASVGPPGLLGKVVTFACFEPLGCFCRGYAAMFQRQCPCLHLGLPLPQQQ